MSAEWRPVDGLPYQVSSEGGVRRSAPGKRTSVGRELRPAVTAKGYLRVGLCDGSGGSPKYLKVHRLVAAAFIPNPTGLPHINHKNGIKTDNRVANLEWVTSAQNMDHAYQTGIRSTAVGADHHAAKLTESQATSIRERLAAGETQRRLAAEFAVSVTTIADIGAGRRWLPRESDGTPRRPPYKPRKRRAPHEGEGAQ